MKKIIAALTVLALISCNKKEETNIQTEENQTVETTEKQEPQSSTLLKEMSQEQISEVFATKKNDTLYVTNFFATWCRPCMDEMPHFQEKIKEMKKYIYQIKMVEGDVNEKRGTLMGYEGNAGKIYYQALAELMPKEFKFEKRSMHPAEDEFNAMLNYAFGILYSKVEKACIIAGLDPYIGIIHTDHYGKKSLVFDIIEGYRHLASRTVFSLFTQKRVQRYFFIKEGTSVTLSSEGKKIVVESFYNRLEKKVRYKNRNVSNLDKLQFECHELANFLISK